MAGAHGITRDPASVKRMTNFIKEDLKSFPPEIHAALDSIEAARFLPIFMHPMMEDTLAR